MEIIKVNEIINRKNNLISMSIFKMEKSYRDFNKYKENLLNLLNFLTPIKGNFDVRVYFDESCVDDLSIDKLLLITKQYPNFEFYKFNYNKMKYENYHFGVLGMMSRFLPMFENEYEYVYITDIDVIPQKLKIEYFNTDFDTIILTRLFYNKPWTEKIKYPIIASTLITKNKIPIKIFNKFLEDVITNKYQKIINIVNEFNNKDQKRKKNISLFPYGMDEYFLNNIVYDYIIKGHVDIIVDTDLIYLIKKMYHQYNNISEIDKKRMYYIIKANRIIYYNTKQEIHQELLKSYIELINILGKDTIIKYLKDNNKTNIESINLFFDNIKNKNIKTLDVHKII